MAEILVGMSIVAVYYDSLDISGSIRAFEVFGRRTDLPELFFLDMLGFMASYEATGENSLIDALVATSLAESNSNAKKAISQGAVTVNNTKILDLKAKLPAQEWLMLGIGKSKRVIVRQSV